MRRGKFRGNEVVVRNRATLVKAFLDLRKKGLIARANFMCCQNCAGYDIGASVFEMSKGAAAKVKGAVFWHHQDEENIWESGRLYLAYGEIDSSKHGRVGLPTVEVGRMVVESLKSWGLTVEWDGKGSTRMQVDLSAESCVPAPVVAEKPKKMGVLKIAGKWNGNAFGVMGNTKNELKRAGVSDEKIDQVMTDARSGDYYHLLAVCMAALRDAGYEIR